MMKPIFLTGPENMGAERACRQWFGDGSVEICPNDDEYLAAMIGGDYVGYLVPLFWLERPG